MTSGGVLFQQQALDLEKQIVAATRRADKAEENATRLSGLLRDEKARGTAQGKEIDGLRAQIVGLERQSADGRVVAGRLADAEKRAQDAEKHATRLADQLAESEKHREWAGEFIQGLEAERDQLSAEADRLGAEIGPFRSLIAALKARAEADAQISVEVGKLDS